MDILTVDDLIRELERFKGHSLVTVSVPIERKGPFDLKQMDIVRLHDTGSCIAIEARNHI
jgi:hypothetical protein